MRWDAYPEDTFRLPLIKRLFESPLSTMTVADSLAHALPTLFDSPLSFVQTFAGPLDVVLPNFDLLAPRLTQKELVSKYNVSTDGFPRQLRTAVTELLSGIAMADSLMRKARAVYSPSEFQFLIADADSLLRQTTEDDKMSVFELKKEEVEGDSVSQAVFSLAVRYPRTLVFEATAILMQSVKIAKTFLAEMPESSRDIVHSVTFTFAIRQGRDRRSGGPDVYAGNYLCIIDLGGDDIYKQPH